MKTNNELLNTDGVKGIITHRQDFNAIRRWQKPFEVDLSLLPLWALPRLIEHTPPRITLITKINIKAPLEVWDEKKLP